jgi:hypothetical protein
MAAESARNDAFLSQRSIYDERYSAGLYDRRSAVPVLTAERDVLNGAMSRVLLTHPHTPRISLFDFGYGTGRVINDWIEGHARQRLGSRDLRVVAYDVSSIGLRQAADRLVSRGCEPGGRFSWFPEATEGYVAGTVHKRISGISISVVFVHGYERQPPDAMRRLALAANDGDRYLLTTSWYSGLGHIPSDTLRREHLRELSQITHPSGEMILCLSATGDLVEIQPEWLKRLETGDTNGFPIERPGDLVYRTELGQENFFHVFGTELNDYMKSITSAGQYWWVEGIRYPDEEFESEQEEQGNYQRVLQANRAKRGRLWDAEDYREFHTVAALRSPLDPRLH